MRAKRSFLSLLLCFAMSFSFLSMNVFADDGAPPVEEPIAITEVTVSGLKAPVIGNDVHDDFNLSVPEGAPYYISTFSNQWYSGSTIVEGNSYRMVAGVYAKDGYYFSSDFTAQLLDEKGNNKANSYGFGEGGSDKYIYIESVYMEAVPVEEPVVTLYDVWANGEQFTSEKLTVDCGSGTATYDPDTKSGTPVRP